MNDDLNCAGFGSGEAFVEGDADFYEAMMQLNTQALVVLTKLFVPAMVEQGRGYVLNVASMAAFYPIPYKTVYSSTK